MFLRMHCCDFEMGCYTMATLLLLSYYPWEGAPVAPFSIMSKCLDFGRWPRYLPSGSLQPTCNCTEYLKILTTFCEKRKGYSSPCFPHFYFSLGVVNQRLSVRKPLLLRRPLHRRKDPLLSWESRCNMQREKGARLILAGSGPGEKAASSVKWRNPELEE